MIPRRVLDLFCGAGGAAMGLHRAWPEAEIIGVDILPMRDYPFAFVQADAMHPPFDLREFDFIWASPPCQAYSAMQHIHKNQQEHPDLVAPTREMLKRTGRPYVIENVSGAPLQANLMLCGTMFGLSIIRHRYFESEYLPFALLPPCDHRNVYDPWHRDRDADKFRSAMGIDWMRDSGGGHRKGTISEAIPPAYSEYIARQLFR